MKEALVCAVRGAAIRRCLVGLIVAIACTLAVAPAVAQGHDVLVFAAGNLKEALQDITGQFERETGKHVRVSLASSPALAKQIENGAPADIFISADLDWMDYLAKHNLIKTSTRRNLVGNRLVLIAPKDSPHGRLSSLDFRSPACWRAAGW